MHSRAKPRGGVFLGGPLSGMLLSLCFFDEGGLLERTIPWFGLLPLLISLERHRYNLQWRLLHGFFFGAIICCWPLLAPGGGAEDSLLSTLWTSLVMTASWMLFCAVGGILFQKPSPLALPPAIAVAWCGIEHLRTEYLPSASPWLQLGELLGPGNPEGGMATVVGLTGLGFLVCLVNTTFFLALRERRARSQLLAVLAASSGVLAMVGLGSLGEDPGRNNDKRGDEGLRIGLVQSAGDGDKLLNLARQLLNSRPRLILFPPLDLEATGDAPGFKAVLDTFVQKEGVAVAAAVQPPPGNEAGMSPSLLYIAAGSEHRVEGPQESLSIETAENRSVLLVTDRVSRSAVRMRRLAEQGAQLFLVTGGEDPGEGEIHRPLERLLEFRALETGIAICRASRNGGSLIIDGRGYRKAEAPRKQDWATVNPVGLLSPPQSRTWFTRGGWLLGPGSLLLLAVLCLLELVRRAKSSAPQDNTRPS